MSINCSFFQIDRSTAIANFDRVQPFFQARQRKKTPIGAFAAEGLHFGLKKKKEIKKEEW